MSAIKEIYAVEWMGPYSSLEEVCERDGSESCFIYLIVGRLPYERTKGIKYVGITKRAPNKRMVDKDHQKSKRRSKTRSIGSVDSQFLHIITWNRNAIETEQS